MDSCGRDYWWLAEAITPVTHGGSSLFLSQFEAQQQPLPVTNPQVIPYGITLPAAQASFSDKPFRAVCCVRMVEGQKRTQQVVHTLIPVCYFSSQIEANLIGAGPPAPPASSLCSRLRVYTLPQLRSLRAGAALSNAARQSC